MANDSLAQAKDPESFLESLLSPERRARLTEAEAKLLRGAPKGTVIIAGQFPTRGSVGADLIRWLCLDPEAPKHVDPRGLRIFAAKIDEVLDLSYATIAFPLSFSSCRFSVPLSFQSTTLPELSLAGCSIAGLNAANLKTSGPVDLGYEFVCERLIDLRGAKIGGDLRCTQGRFAIHMLPDQAICGSVIADQAVIDGAVIFTNCSFSGTVSLRGARIGADLDCRGTAVKGPHLPALYAEGAEIKGSVILAEAFSAKGGISFYNAQVGGDLNCHSAVLSPYVYPRNSNPLEILKLNHCELAPTVPLKGLILDAGQSHVAGSIILDYASIRGGVNLAGTSIEKDLSVEHTKLEGEDHPAFFAERLVTGGNVLLTNHFLAEGDVTLLGAHVGGDLNCNGATFNNPDGVALNLARAEITGSALLAGGVAAGTVYLYGTKIGKDLTCESAKLSAKDQPALNAEKIEIEGSLVLRDVRVEGEVSLVDAHISHDLDCAGGRFSNPSGNAMNAALAVIDGSVSFGKGSTTSGKVNLANAQIGADLNCTESQFDSIVLSQASIKKTFYLDQVKAIPELDLSNATVGNLSSNKQSWPQKGKLHLDGFVYGGIGDDLRDPDWRLIWLDLSDFTPRPYRQLAKVLHDLGDEDGSKRVLMELENRTREETRKRLAHTPERGLREAADTLSRLTVGYGIYPGLAVREMCLLTALGWIVFRRAKLRGAMAPSDKDAYEYLHSNSRLPDSYPPFNPFIYSFEICIPILKLGQDDKWQPDPTPMPYVPVAPVHWFDRLKRWVSAHTLDQLMNPCALRWIRWLIIVIGWLLATFFVAGLSGIVRTN